MRDIIWTLIVVWLIYKIVGIFKNSSAKTTSSETNNNQNTNTSGATFTKKDIKSAIKKHVNNEGKYVDFEEVK